jgi:hypothetical protein
MRVLLPSLLDDKAIFLYACTLRQPPRAVRKPLWRTHMKKSPCYRVDRFNSVWLATLPSSDSTTTTGFQKEDGFWKRSRKREPCNCLSLVPIPPVQGRYRLKAGTVQYLSATSAATIFSNAHSRPHLCRKVKLVTLQLVSSTFG